MKWLWCHLEQHLHTYKAEDDAQAIFQVLEILSDGCESEIEGTQTQDGEDVRREYDKWVATHGEDRGNRIDSKGHICCLNHQEGDKEWGGQSFPVLDDKEFILVHLIRYGEELLE